MDRGLFVCGRALSPLFLSRQSDRLTDEHVRHAAPQANDGERVSRVSRAAKEVAHKERLRGAPTHLLGTHQTLVAPYFFFDERIIFLYELVAVRGKIWTIKRALLDSQPFLWSAFLSNIAYTIRSRISLY